MTETPAKSRFELENTFKKRGFVDTKNLFVQVGFSTTTKKDEIDCPLDEDKKLHKYITVYSVKIDGSAVFNAANVEEQECYNYLTWIKTATPFVTYVSAVSISGEGGGTMVMEEGFTPMHLVNYDYD